MSQDHCFDEEDLVQLFCGDCSYEQDPLSHDDSNNDDGTEAVEVEVMQETIVSKRRRKTKDTINQKKGPMMPPQYQDDVLYKEPPKLIIDVVKTEKHDWKIFKGELNEKKMVVQRKSALKEKIQEYAWGDDASVPNNQSTTWCASSSLLKLVDIILFTIN